MLFRFPKAKKYRDVIKVKYGQNYFSSNKIISAAAQVLHHYDKEDK